MSYNKVILQGNISSDIDLKDIGSTNLAKFSLAVNHKYKDKKDVCFFNIEVWGKQASNVSQYCSKGSPILVEGRMKQENWEAQDGTKRSKYVVVSENVVFLSFKDKEKNERYQSHNNMREPSTGQNVFEF